MSSGHKAYTSDLPILLHNRPRDMVLHCLEKIEAAKQYDKEDVECVSPGVYTVKAMTDGTVKYTVNMNSPHCECHDWLCSNYPCKHMFAVERICNTNLPQTYMSNPWFTLDDLVTNVTPHAPGSAEVDDDLEQNDVCPDPAEVSDNKQQTDVCSDEKHSVDASEQDDTPVKEVLEKKRSINSRALRTNIKDYCQQIVSSAYIIPDETTLQSIEKDLVSLLQKCQSKLAYADSLPLNLPSRKRKITTVPCVKDEHKETLDLPKRQSQRSKQKYDLDKLNKKETDTRDVIDNDVIYIASTTPSEESTQTSDAATVTNSSKLCKTEDDLCVYHVNESILNMSYWLTDIDINLAIRIMAKQWPEVIQQDCLLIQREQGFNRVAGQGIGLYAQVCSNGWFNS